MSAASFKHFLLSVDVDVYLTISLRLNISESNGTRAGKWLRKKT